MVRANKRLNDARCCTAYHTWDRRIQRMRSFFSARYFDNGERANLKDGHIRRISSRCLPEMILGAIRTVSYAEVSDRESLLRPLTYRPIHLKLG